MANVNPVNQAVNGSPMDPMTQAAMARIFNNEAAKALAEANYTRSNNVDKYDDQAREFVNWGGKFILQEVYRAKGNYEWVPDPDFWYAFLALYGKPEERRQETLQYLAEGGHPVAYFNLMRAFKNNDALISQWDFGGGGQGKEFLKLGGKFGIYQSSQANEAPFFYEKPAGYWDITPDPGEWEAFLAVTEAPERPYTQTLRKKLVTNRELRRRAEKMAEDYDRIQLGGFGPQYNKRRQKAIEVGANGLSQANMFKRNRNYGLMDRLLSYLPSYYVPPTENTTASSMAFGFAEANAPYMLERDPVTGNYDFKVQNYRRRRSGRRRRY